MRTLLATLLLFVAPAAFAGYGDDRYPDLNGLRGVRGARNTSCSVGTIEDAHYRLQYTTAVGTPTPGDTVTGQSSGTTANLLLDYGSGTGAGWIVQTVSGPGFRSGEVACTDSPTCAESITLTAAQQETGVYACEWNDGTGFLGVEKVMIDPRRASGTDESTAVDYILARYDSWFYCTDNSRFDASTAGQAIKYGCRVELVPGTYQATGTRSFLGRLRRQANPSADAWLGYEFDARYSVIYHALTTPTAITGATLGTAGHECTEARAGQARVITDAQHFDDMAGGTDTTFTIQAAGAGTGTRLADDNDDDACVGAAEGGQCDFGTNSTVLVLNAAHTYDDGDDGNDDGGMRNQGDFITIASSADSTCNDTRLVKSAGGSLAAEELIITPDSTCSPSDLAGATVTRANTTVFCTGTDWLPGWPLEAYGGPTIGTITGASVTGINHHHSHYRVVSGNFNRPAGIALIGYYGADDGGGVNDALITDITNLGQTDEYGQVLVWLHARPYGIAPTGSQVCQDVYLERIVTDFWGTGSATSVLNDGCKNNIRLELTTQHGGMGYRQRFADNSTFNPQAVVADFNLEGCRDGPCIWIENGAISMRGKIGGDVGAGSAGERRGVTAILGHTGSGGPAVINADGMDWSNVANLSNRCQLHLNNVHFTQFGGRVGLTAKLEAGDADHGFACEHNDSNVHAFLLMNPQLTEIESVSADDVTLWQTLSAPASRPTGAVICPGCSGPFRRYGFKIYNAAVWGGGGGADACLVPDGADSTSVLTTCSNGTPNLWVGQATPAGQKWLGQVHCQLLNDAGFVDVDDFKLDLKFYLGETGGWAGRSSTMTFTGTQFGCTGVAATCTPEPRNVTKYLLERAGSEATLMALSQAANKTDAGADNQQWLSCAVEVAPQVPH